ncbi:hypothetical protein FRACA_220043 [Frankia canadensis]|uniref:Uncharacterized protein n=1 Tax=Frankia canadensis TaxID=1836972 RepID=A0A2I2KR09_9ACTN|nr:hypothetical protein [Frankia canadensis]SNQ48103.1 hypothetical protein FRACA_220043 [Frankia canadensis]SOU55393.1 hypothetical protein FRACA_220043 [Frankia canadensis]
MATSLSGARNDPGARMLCGTWMLVRHAGVRSGDVVLTLPAVTLRDTRESGPGP